MEWLVGHLCVCVRLFPPKGKKVFYSSRYPLDGIMNVPNTVCSFLMEYKYDDHMFLK